MYDPLDITPRQVLKLLFWIRNLAAIGQVGTIYFVHNLLGSEMPVPYMLAVVIVLLVWNLVTARVLRREKPISQEFVLLNLVIDISILVALFYFAGGVANPFISFLLIPVAFAAAFMSGRHVGLLCIFTIASYSLIMVYSVGLPDYENLRVGNFSVNTLSTWVNFSVSALLLSIFVNRMVYMIRKRDRELTDATIEMQENDKIVALGSMAVGVTHAISTPLSTMSILLHDMKRKKIEDSKDDIQLLISQVNLCRDKLTEYIEQTSNIHGVKKDKITLSEFLNGLVDELRITYPEVEIRTEFSLKSDAYIVPDIALSQAIINILNNAVEATMENSGTLVKFNAQTDHEFLRMTISDYGKGIHESDTSSLLFEKKSSKKHGMGIGMILSKQNLRRFNGTLQYHNRGNGTDMMIRLPLGTIQK